MEYCASKGNAITAAAAKPATGGVVTAKGTYNF